MSDIWHGIYIVFLCVQCKCHVRLVQLVHLAQPCLLRTVSGLGTVPPASSAPDSPSGGTNQSDRKKEVSLMFEKKQF